MAVSPLAMPVIPPGGHAASEGKLDEQRRSERFEMQLPVLVVRIGTRPVCNMGETRNIGSDGLLMAVPAPMSIGDSIEFAVMLTMPAEGTPALRLNCKGRVLRAENFLYAATIERYEFVRDHPAT